MTLGECGKRIDEFESMFLEQRNAQNWMREETLKLIHECLGEDGPDAPGCEAYWNEDGTTLKEDVIEANYDQLAEALLFGDDVGIPWTVDIYETPVEW